MYERVVTPTSKLGPLLSEREKRKVKVYEIMWRNGGVGNPLIRQRSGYQTSIMKTMEWKVLEWFGHLGRMGED